MSKLENPEPQPTLIFDRNGELASKVSNSKIEGVSLEEVSEHVINAVISTEDQRFFKHNGIDMIGIARAFLRNTIEGEVVAGGSTITQQLSKNAFLNQERTYSRKFKELILSMKIERTYSKDEILERYINQIYFGEGAWGIERAAQIYFGKNASELTLQESATLAGLIKAPSKLSPYKNMEKAKERRDLVLTLMRNEGYISQAEMEQAKAEPIELIGKGQEKYKGNYPYYVDQIISEATEKYNLTANEVLSGGLRIYTELNPAIQKVVESVYNDDANFPESTSDQLIQSGTVLIDSKTGGIVALVGGRGDFTYGNFNYATDLVRQPGSTMKPLAVYTSALEQGYEMTNRLLDKPIRIGEYKPKNYDGNYRGEVSMYEAVVKSYNIPAVWLLYQIGLENGVKAARKFGIPLEKEDHSYGLALGGLHKGTSPLKMAQAFSTFPNNGVMIEAHTITKIENANGEVITSWEEKASKVTDESVAQKMTFMLKGVVSQGTGKNANVRGIEIAGKTGTTQVPFEGTNGGSKDHWFVGYTPEIVGAVWLGYEKTDKNHYLTSSSGSTAAVIFQKIISGSMDELGEKEFDLPLVGKYLKEKEQERQKEKGRGKDRDKDRDKKDRGKGNGKGKGKRDKNDEDD
ncbi:transglycosylase domain-containing protein [Bacillus salitolerans]|uniref:Transglycosylase domain-containing protein n=1 Tax=Bacillus salitolerans TaxID=1437434 RepID=A0ABW4LWM0_9BACI